MKAEWPPGGRWEWDGRFGCALTTLNQGNEATGRAVLLAHLPAQWTRETLGQAPALVKQVCAVTGGLKGTQFVFSVNLGEAVIYCLWWPWGDGTTFSVRVGVASADSSSDPKVDLRAAFDV
jgi:hypothetical protein